MTSRADRKYFLTLHQYFQFSVLTSGLGLIRLFLQLKSNKSVGGGREQRTISTWISLGKVEGQKRKLPSES